MVKKLFLFVSITIGLQNIAFGAQSFLFGGERALFCRSFSSRRLYSPTRPLYTIPTSETPLLEKQNHFVQTYGIATYDALFKYVLSDDKVRPSFFHAFVPGLNIKSSYRLDDHMNPFNQFESLRAFLHKRENIGAVSRLAGKSDVRVVSTSDRRNSVPHPRATEFLKEVLRRFDELRLAFPEQKYDGTMDFVCQLDNGEHVMVEMQVLPQDHWDDRALAYVAAFYGNQLRKGGHWKHIRRVIGINILGGGKDDVVHWKETPDQYVRHYKFQEQLHVQPTRYIGGIELIQYSIMNAPKSQPSSEQEKQDWIIFFKRGYRMTEEEVKETIKTPEVLRAFERARLGKLPKEIKMIYDAEDREYDRYSQHTAERVADGVKEGEKKGRSTVLSKAICALYGAGKSISEIASDLDIPEVEVKGILENQKDRRDILKTK